MKFRKQSEPPKEKAVVEPPKEPERLTQEEWGKLEEYKREKASLEAEEKARPQSKDFVRVLIYGMVGQIVDVEYLPPLKYGYFSTPHTPPKNELERVSREVDGLRTFAAFNNNRLRYSIRLKNGYIIRELRLWEIHRHMTPIP
jgi:hypothetical protein